ncbi:MAG: hypothetical protein A2W61_04785 [Deltaproteobacteria bacterium RIFCSPLOWO2_01_44_7]|nr:MAG: hypothetical protein A2W61_04785 [Deltaproteobacteria bacterium RIFCSPLOWO2_01_44_7]
MESLVILKSKGEIEEKDLPEKIRGYKTAHKGNTQVNIPDTGLSLRHALSAFENELILKALQKTGWNKNKAATLLKLNRTTLVEKIKKKGLEKVIAKHEN